MYSFEDTQKDKIKEVENLSAEAMSFDGKILEKEIDGYRTLSVDGRELIGKKIKTQDVEGRDGRLFLLSSLPNREITVKYMLVADSARDFRDKYNHLNYLLQGENVPIFFNDEPDFTFYGTFSGAGAVESGRLRVVSEFGIECTDPFKYGLAKTYSGIGTVEVKDRFLYPTKADTITITPTATANKLTLVCNGKTIVLEDTFASGQPIVVDFRNFTIWVNGAEKADVMSWASDFEDFYIPSNGIVTVTPSHPIKVTVRRKML